MQATRTPPPPLPPLAAVAALSPRQREVLKYIGQSLGDEQIAAEIHRSVSTVEFHIKSLHQRLGTVSRTHLATTAITYGLAAVPESPPASI